MTFCRRTESLTGNANQLLVATHNQGKKQEYLELLAPLRVDVRFPDEMSIHLEVRDDGDTYAENARKKARPHALASEMLTIADDSGLEVDALGGAPGIHSARYASGTDADRVQALLSDLTGVPWDERTARFHCVIAMVTPEGSVHQAKGVCEGQIAYAPAGEGGFGYDPIFYVSEYGKTMAQLSRRTKNRISHRARAVEAALPTLKHLLEEQRADPPPG